MSKINQEVWNSFIYGQSDDDYNISKGQFVFSENVDVKRTGFQYRLTPKPVKVNFTNAQMNGFIGLENTSGNSILYYYGDAGRVYNQTSADNTPEFTVTGGSPIVNAIEFGTYVYFISSNNVTCTIYRDLKSNLIAETYSGSSFTPSLDPIPAPGFSNCKGLVYGEKMVLGIGKELYSIDDAGVGTSMQLFPDDIMGLTTVADLLKVYLRNGTVYYVNAADGTIVEFRKFGIQIRNVLEVNGIDYLLGGSGESSSEFYVVDGYTPQPLKKAKRSLRNYPMGIAGDKLEFQKNNYRFWMAQLQDDVLLVDNGVHYDRITHYGNINDNFPRVFSNILATNSQGLNSRVIGAMYYWKEKIYYYYNDITNGGVDSVSIFPGSPYQSNGFIFTDIFDAGIKSRKKKIEELRFKFENVSVGNEIKLAYSLDGGAYTEIISKDSGNRVKINPTAEFYNIQFRIELKQAASFEELILYYNLVENG